MVWTETVDTDWVRIPSSGILLASQPDFKTGSVKQSGTSYATALLLVEDESAMLDVGPEVGSEVGPDSVVGPGVGDLVGLLVGPEVGIIVGPGVGPGVGE